MSASFLTDTPTFTLLARTRGGPPTTYSWTRDGQATVTDRAYSVSISANLTAGDVAYRESHYYSMLSVTGRLPGVYQYSVSNRVTPTPLTDNINIKGEMLGSADVLCQRLISLMRKGHAVQVVV